VVFGCIFGKVGLHGRTASRRHEKKVTSQTKKKAFNLGAFVDPLCFYGKTKNEIKNMKNDTYNNQLLKDEN